MSPIVRDATARDAAAIAALHVRSWQAAYRGLVADDVLDGLSEDAWSERWTGALTGARPEGVHRLVSADTADGPPRAVAVCGPAEDGVEQATGALYVLYADPPVWGRGHGSVLLREVHGRLAADGHRAALLWVAAGNDRTIGFYEHHGWTRDGTARREDVHGVPFDEVRMVRQLV